MQKYFETVTDVSGRAISGASVTVYATGTQTKSTIYSDNGVTTTTNPVTTNALGYFEFYVADGRYDITISGSGITTRTISDVLIEDPASGIQSVALGGTGASTAAGARTNLGVTSTADFAASTGSSLVGHIASGTGAEATTVQAKLRESVSVFDFMTSAEKADVEAGTRLVDVTAAIQAAVNTGKNVYFNPGLYEHSGVITVSTRGQVLYGPGVAGVEATIADAASGTAGAVLASSVNDSSHRILITGTQVEIRGLGFYGSGTSNTQTALKFSAVTNTDDMDGYVSDCCFVDYSDAVSHVGRGLTARGNIFVNCTRPISLSWPASGTVITATEQDLPLGHRACRINGNRFHSCASSIITSGETLRAAQIVGNLVDIGERLLESTAGIYKCLIADNIVDQCSRNPINIEGSVVDCAIVNNQFGGTSGTQAQSPLYGAYFNNCGTITNLTIAGNTFTDIDGHAIGFDGTATTIEGLSVTGNTFDNIGQDGATPRAIIRSAQNLERLVFTSNIVVNSTLSNIVSFDVGTRTLTDSTLANNSWDQAVTLVNTFTDGGNNSIIYKSAAITTSSGGNVGINTASPLSRLHVTDTASVPMRLERTGSAGGVGVRHTNTAGYVEIFGTATGSNAGSYIPGADNVIALGGTSNRWSNVYGTNLRPGAGTVTWTAGAGTPEGSVTGAIGSLYTRTDGGAGTTLYVKESGAGNTGWRAV